MGKEINLEKPIIVYGVKHESLDQEKSTEIKKKGEEIEDLINGRFIHSTPDVITSFMSRYRKQAKEKICDLDKLKKLKPLARRETQGF